jgi:outer membrane protein insertion porin family
MVMRSAASLLFCLCFCFRALAAASDANVPGKTQETSVTTSAHDTVTHAAVSDTHMVVKVIDKIIIKGLAINSTDVVKNNIELHQGSKFIASNVKESVRKLFGLELFRSIDIFVTAETDSGVSLLIKLEEYPLCESIEYAGLAKLKQKDLEEKLPLKRGQIISDDAVFRAQSHIKEEYAKKGYLLADVSVERVASKIPGNMILKFIVKEGQKVQIRHISFKGNNAVSSSKLKGKFKTKESRWWRSGDYDEELYRAHLDTLVLYYNDLGYLDASIVKDSIWYSESKKDINIEITVDEGKKYHTGKFFFTGNMVIPTDSLLHNIILKEGKPFQKSDFDMSRYFVENAYREEGYLWVQIDDQKSYRGDTIDVTFSVYEGKPAIVRKIDIKGNLKTREKVIRREIDLVPGQRYSQSLMMSSRQRIFALNFFSDVKPDISPNSDNTIDLIFEVTEKDNIGTFQIGAAYSQIDGFVGTVSLGIPNFRGAGEDVKIDCAYGLYSKRIDLGFMEPWAFDSPTSLSGRIFYNWGVPLYYTSRRDTIQSYGFSVGAGRSRLSWPDNHFSLQGTYQISYEMSTYYADSTSPIIKVLRAGFLSRLSCDIMRYDFDMPQFPTSGSKLTISPQFAGLGGDFKYIKGIVAYEHYFPLPYKLVLGSNSKFGLIAPLGGGPIKISRYDLFKIGGVYGDADLRGYKEYWFGGYYNRPELGISMFASTLELRYPLLEQQLYLGVFGDIGNTWPTLAMMDFSDLYKGVGFGLRLNIPMMGIMGFDFAWGLDDDTHAAFGGKPHGFELHFLMNRGF